MRTFTEALEKMARYCADNAMYNADDGYDNPWEDVPFHAVAVTLATAYNKPDSEVLSIHNRLKDRARSIANI